MTLLFVIGLTACSKSDDPLPEKVFQDVNKTAEDYIGELNPNLYYNFFRFQNDSDHTLYWGINTKFSTIMGLYYCRPGQQATDQFSTTAYIKITANSCISLQPIFILTFNKINSTILTNIISYRFIYFIIIFQTINTVILT